MESTDLMLGDYILVNEEVQQVTKLTNYIHYGDNKRIGKKDSVQGVPLTREFFESNNFEHKSEGFKLCSNLFWSRNGIYLLTEDVFGSHSYLYIMKCSLVHELQHLLNQCNPSKKVIYDGKF